MHRFRCETHRTGCDRRRGLECVDNTIRGLAALLPLSPPMKPARTLRTSSDAALVSVRIEVLGGDAISSQARAYAEYRVFAALTQIPESRQVRRARVVLRSVSRRRSGDRVSCTVTVSLAGKDPFRVRAIGPHACAAINRAVDRITSQQRQLPAGRDL
jgi:hypothetical protein